MGDPPEGVPPTAGAVGRFGTMETGESTQTDLHLARIRKPESHRHEDRMWPMETPGADGTEVGEPTTLQQIDRRRSNLVLACQGRCVTCT